VQSAILSWLVEGCLAWQKEETLSEPKAVLAATQEYREDNDTLKGWMETCIVMGANFSEQSSMLRNSYEQWCKENGEKPIATSRAWGAALRRCGFTPGTDAKAGKGTRRWAGGMVRRGPRV